MITPELTEYIKGEFAKGRTREEIHIKLVADGGWSEADLNEAFRTVVPMQNFAKNPLVTANSFSKKSSGAVLENLIFIIIGILCVATWWFFRPQIVAFYNSSMDKLAGLSFPSIPFDKIFNNDKAPVADSNEAETETAVQNCGIGTMPDLKNPSTYQNDGVLACLGENASRCANVTAVLASDLFPTIFQIENMDGEGTCNFRLSYGEDSSLADIAGKPLAGQYISCPLGIVKAVNEEDPQSPTFDAPSIGNRAKYASEIYFYGTLGLFMENSLNPNKIRSLGCNGPYIDSVVASYQRMLSEQ